MGLNRFLKCCQMFRPQTKASLPVTKIQSVKAVRKDMREIPRAFQIFTEDNTYMFKAKGFIFSRL